MPSKHLRKRKKNKTVVIFFNKNLLFVKFTQKKKFFFSFSYRFNELGDDGRFVVVVDADGGTLSNGFDNCLLYNG